jgi:hypothetical protein
MNSTRVEFPSVAGSPAGLAHREEHNRGGSTRSTTPWRLRHWDQVKTIARPGRRSISVASPNQPLMCRAYWPRR